MTAPTHAEVALDAATAAVHAYLAQLPDASTAPVSPDLLSTLPDESCDVASTVSDLVGELAVGVMPSTGPRYFGFVTGGCLPAALAAEVLTAGWDQNAALAVMSPAMSQVETVTAEWVAELLGLPDGLSAGFVTGATMANWTALAAARWDVLDRQGWDLTEHGLNGSPEITVLVGAQRHSAIDLALRYLGLGRRHIVEVAADDQGRMRADSLAQRLESVSGPLIVCAQAGNVNSGSIDPLADICTLAHEAGGWVHIDAAVGAWLAASPRLRGQLEGWDRADSWALDAHKGLNTAYDSGIVLSAHPAAHEAATSTTAAYLQAGDGVRDGMSWTPESSRRARALGIYATLRQLGRTGVAELVEQQCELAARFAGILGTMPGVRVANAVTANQVVVRFGDDDAITRAVIAEVQRGGVCWMGGTQWQGQAMMRISVSNWMTTAADIDRSAAEIGRCLAAVT